MKKYNAFCVLMRKARRIFRGFCRAISELMHNIWRQDIVIVLKMTATICTYQLDKGYHTYHVVNGRKRNIKFKVWVIACTTRVLDLEKNKNNVNLDLECFKKYLNKQNILVKC